MVGGRGGPVGPGPGAVGEIGVVGALNGGAEGETDRRSPLVGTSLTDSCFWK